MTRKPLPAFGIKSAPRSCAESTTVPGPVAGCATAGLAATQLAPISAAATAATIDTRPSNMPPKKYIRDDLIAIIQPTLNHRGPGSIARQPYPASRGQFETSATAADRLAVHENSQPQWTALAIRSHRPGSLVRRSVGAQVLCFREVWTALRRPLGGGGSGSPGCRAFEEVTSTVVAVHAIACVLGGSGRSSR